MVYVPPPRSRGTAKSSSDSQPVETEKEHKPRRKRSGSRGTTRRIQRTAQARQGAWSEGGKPNVTQKLTGDLDVLYGEHRGEQAGTLTVPFRGRTWRPQ